MTVRFVSDLAGNSDDRFSRVEAQSDSFVLLEVKDNIMKQSVECHVPNALKTKSMMLI